MAQQYLVTKVILGVLGIDMIDEKHGFTDDDEPVEFGYTDSSILVHHQWRQETREYRNDRVP